MTSQWAKFDLLCEIAVWLEMEDRYRRALAVYPSKSEAQWLLETLPEITPKIACVTSIGDIRCKDHTEIWVRYEVNGQWPNLCGGAMNHLFLHPDLSETTRDALVPGVMGDGWDYLSMVGPYR